MRARDIKITTGTVRADERGTFETRIHWWSLQWSLVDHRTTPHRERQPSTHSHSWGFSTSAIWVQLCLVFKPFHKAVVQNSSGQGVTTQGDSGERLHTDENHQLWRIYNVKDLCMLEAREGCNGGWIDRDKKSC